MPTATLRRHRVVLAALAVVALVAGGAVAVARYRAGDDVVVRVEAVVLGSFPATVSAGAATIVANQAAFDFVWADLGASAPAPRTSFELAGDPAMVLIAAIGVGGEKCWAPATTLSSRTAPDEFKPVGDDYTRLDPIRLELDAEHAAACSATVEGPATVVAISVAEHLVSGNERDLTVDGLGIVAAVPALPGGSRVLASTEPLPEARWAMSQYVSLDSPDHFVSLRGVGADGSLVELGPPGDRTIVWDDANPRCGSFAADALPSGIDAVVWPQPLQTADVAAIIIADASYRTIDNLGVGLTRAELLAVYDESLTKHSIAPLAFGAQIASDALTVPVGAQDVGSPSATTQFTFWLDATDTVIAMMVGRGDVDINHPWCGDGPTP